MRGHGISHGLPRATSVRFAAAGDTEYLIAVLASGSAVVVPLDYYPTLKAASPAQRRRWKLVAAGQGVSWPDLDLDLSTEGLVAGRPDATAKARAVLTTAAAKRLTRVAIANRPAAATAPNLAKLLAQTLSPAALRNLARSIQHLAKAS
ncbi:MAG: DUF2442 domain-containing protein [Phycisphaerales bacterium]